VRDAVVTGLVEVSEVHGVLVGIITETASAMVRFPGGARRTGRPRELPLELRRSACEAEATSRGVPNPASARAWVPDENEHARDRIPQGPYFRFDGGQMIAIELADLTDGFLVNPLSAALETRIWTGTSWAGYSSPTQDCSAWTDGTGSSFGLWFYTDWHAAGVGPCSFEFAVACFTRDDRFGTDPNLDESDADGLLDGAEVSLHATDPALADTDGDGVGDGIEVAAGTDPRDPLDFPVTPVLALGAAIRLLLGLGLAVAAGLRLLRA